MASFACRLPGHLGRLTAALAGQAPVSRVKPELGKHGGGAGWVVGEGRVEAERVLVAAALLRPAGHPDRPEVALWIAEALRVNVVLGPHVFASGAASEEAKVEQVGKLLDALVVPLEGEAAAGLGRVEAGHHVDALQLEVEGRGARLQPLLVAEISDGVLHQLVEDLSMICLRVIY